MADYDRMKVDKQKKIEEQRPAGNNADQLECMLDTEVAERRSAADSRSRRRVYFEGAG